MRRQRKWLAAGVAGIVAVAVAVVIILVQQPGPAAKPVTIYQLSAAPLGVNVAPWDSTYAGSSASVIQPLLKAAGVRQLRYGGGSYADFYDWQTNTNIGNCLPGNTTASATASCASSDPLDFSLFSRQASAIGADKFVTVNYGSGTPAEAAAWVKAAGQQVALWEVGNESYGCYEVDNELAEAPAQDHGYVPAVNGSSGQHCPSTGTLAASYADHALLFLKAMKQADPEAVIGVPWAFGDSVQGSDVADSDEWNATVLKADGADAGFVDAHYYPFNFAGSAGGSNPTDAQVLQALPKIPSLAASVKAGLAKYDPKATVVIGETGVSSNATTTSCTPVGALFAAGDVLSWLASGVQSVDWWDLNNDGNTGSTCTNPDYGLFTSASTPAPETPYYGYLLASALAQPGAKLGFLDTSGSADVLAYQATLPGGKHAVAFINLDTSAAQTVTFDTPDGLTGTLRTETYSAATPKVVKETTTAAGSVTLPAESVTVLET